VKTSFVIDFVCRATLTVVIVAGVVTSGPTVAGVVLAIEGTKCSKVGSIRSKKISLRMHRFGQEESLAQGV